jgi:hypothetical protein
VIGTVLDSMFKDNIATLTYVDGKYEWFIEWLL